MNEETKIPTSKGMKSPAEIIDYLTYCSYAANRGYGMTHEQLLSIGIGNDQMRSRYETTETEETAFNIDN